MAVHCNIVSIVIFTISIGLLLATFYSHKPHNARYIFVDLGANRADSLETFLGHKDVKFAYDFPHPEWAMHDEAGEFKIMFAGRSARMIIFHVVLFY